MLQGTPTVNRQPCKHDVCAAQHSIREDGGNAVYSSVDECCFPELTRSSQRVRKQRRTFCDLSSDSGEESSDHRERIPTLGPGQFDGFTSWREFLNRFEDCARANHWSERTMTVQMRFCLVGAAGSVIHKNPRSGRWSYARIVEKVEAAYGPSSEHAAAIGIELRQRVRVEVFTNTMGDADIMERLLEVRPRTLARAYEIAHSWVFKDPELWQPQEVPAPSLEADEAELHLDLSRLFTEETRSSGSPDSMPLMDDTGMLRTEQDTEDVQWSEGSTVQQDLTGTVDGQMRGRPQQVRRPPRRFGDWTN
ncbi:hypothetical protein Q8A67_020190 [Cirrhinus molitorella]|uniref:Uncharacterized protein n=1 Tax=Cirrhinus molitorella TaxID=172907 RepID=A0AA88TDS6_9TELE|nr:hypothetical protein Q8A67_020190 [Cirrhinus molitorella]